MEGRKPRWVSAGRRRPGHLLLGSGLVLLLLLFSAGSATLVAPAVSGIAAPGRGAGDRVRVFVAPVAKIAGDLSAVPLGVLRRNGGMDHVLGMDLGYPALYHGRWYLAFGDTRLDSTAVGGFPWYPDLAADNFVVAVARPGSLQSGLPFSGFLNVRPTALTRIRAPFRAIAGHDTSYTLPGGLYTVQYHGHETLIASYMLGGNAGGFTHYAERSTIAVFDSHDGRFHDYKPAVYRWSNDGRLAAGGVPAQYDFGNDVFWEDPTEHYLYLIGASPNRYGGAKLARIPVAAFLNPADRRGWSYWLGSSWSDPLIDERAIAPSVAWIIPPRDPAWSPLRTYLHAADPCADRTIAEFSVVYSPYLRSFLLLTGTSGCPPYGVSLYQAPALTGPWTGPAAVALPFQDGAPGGLYAPYTTGAMEDDNGRLLYFLLSTWNTYGVYLFRATFYDPHPPALLPTRPRFRILPVSHPGRFHAVP